MSNETESLGTITKFASRPEKSLSDFRNQHGNTAAKFALQALAREITPDERVRICWRHRLPDRHSLDLVHFPPAGDQPARGHVAGLMHCCSVWVCAVCSARVSQQRRIDLTAAVDANRIRYMPVMVTYTARHNVRDKLADLLAGLQDAYRRFRSGRWWQGWKNIYGAVASVRATEITYGDNGWHAHYHEILWFEVGFGWSSLEALQVASDEIELMLSQRWLSCLDAVGMSADRQHGLTVSSHAGDIGDYLAKYGHLPATEKNGWTIAHEVTMQQTKKAGGSGGVTPWEILWNAHHNAKSAQLWREYVKATKGRSQLHWSRGAKDLLGIADLSDDDIIAADDSAESELLATLTIDQWKVFAECGVIPQLLDAAAAKNMPRIERMIATADAALTPKNPVEQCLPCSVEHSRKVFFEPRGTSLVCPECGTVSKTKLQS